MNDAPVYVGVLLLVAAFVAMMALALTGAVWLFWLSIGLTGASVLLAGLMWWLD